MRLCSTSAARSLYARRREDAAGLGRIFRHCRTMSRCSMLLLPPIP